MDERSATMLAQESGGDIQYANAPANAGTGFLSHFDNRTGQFLYSPAGVADIGNPGFTTRNRRRLALCDSDFDLSQCRHDLLGRKYFFSASLTPSG
jgi:hypothetical protein